MARKSSTFPFCRRVRAPFSTTPSPRPGSPLARPTRIEPLEARLQFSATLVSSFGSGGQLIGAAHNASAVDVLLPYSAGGIFQFTGGNTITRRLLNGALDTRFGGSDGSITIAGRNPIQAVAAAPDGSVYVEYALTRGTSTTTNDVGFQHFLKSGRLDAHFGSHRLLDIANYDRSATTIGPGPIAVSSEGRLYWEGASSLYSIPNNGSVAGIRKTDTNGGGTRLVIGRGGSLFLLGNGVTQYNANFQRVSSFGNDSVAITGDTVTDGAFDASGRLVLTVAGASDTAAPQLVRLTTRGTLDSAFGTAGSVALPSDFLSAGVDYTGSHLVVESDGSVIVAGSVNAAAGATAAASSQPALLDYDHRGRLIDREFSASSNGALTSTQGTLQGGEVDVIAGPDDTIYLATVVSQAAKSGTKPYDFLEEFGLKPASSV